METEEKTVRTLQDMITEYLSYLEIERGLSKNTILAYQTDLNLFFNFIELVEKKENLSLEEIKRKDFSTYTKYLAKNEINPSSITRKIASIKGFFKYLCFNRDISKNPAVSIVSPKLPKKLPRVLTINEIETILKENLNSFELAIIELLYSAGIRVSELTELQLKNVDLKQKIIKVFGKGAKERIIPINQKCVNILSKYLK